MAPGAAVIDGTAPIRNPSRITATAPVRLDGQDGPSPLRPDRRASTGGGFFPVIRRWAVVIAVATGIATLVGWGLAQRATPTYQARAEMLVGPLNTDIATVRAATAATGTYVQLAGAPATIEVVARRTGVDRDLLYAGVRVSADPEARILVVRARAHTAADAADAANGVADRLIELAAEDSTAPAGRLSRIDVATPPSSPVSPRIEVITPLAAVAGLLAGLALVMVLELVGDPAGSVAEVRRATRAATVSLPPAGHHPGDARGGEVVATQLALLRPGARSVLLTGTADADGGGRLVLELAASWAGTGDRVVLVDAGAGEMTTVMGLDGRSGVQEALAGVEVAPTPLGGGVEALGGIRPPDAASGTGFGSELGLGEAVAAGRVVDDLVSSGARVVVHAPPAITAAATLAWARAVDATVLVSRRDTGRRGPLEETAAALRQVGADLAFVAIHPGGRGAGRRRRRAPRQLPRAVLRPSPVPA